MPKHKVGSLVGIGRLLRDAMIRRGLTRAQFSEPVGIKTNTLKSVMEGYRSLPEQYYEKTMEILDLSRLRRSQGI